MGLLSGLFDFGSSIYNSERNLDFQRENLRYQKELQQQIFNREDTAVRRRAADLKAAGMNPLLAAGGAASSGQAVMTSAPQGSIKSNFADIALMRHRMKIDNSMTKAQQELIHENVEIARKNSKLLQKQIDFYDNHPNVAPGVDTTKTAAAGIQNIAKNVRNFLGGLYDNFKANVSKYSNRLGG